MNVVCIGKESWMIAWFDLALKYSRTSIIRFNWDDKPSPYAENPDNWNFL
jgi:hypothetical protein